MSANATGYFSAQPMFPTQNAELRAARATGNVSSSSHYTGYTDGDWSERNFYQGFMINVSHTHTFSGTTNSTGSTTNRVKSIGINYIIKI